MATVQMLKPQTGLLVKSDYLTVNESAVKNIVGNSFAGLLGIASANAVDSPVTVVASGGMQITVGGVGDQKLLLNSANGPRMVDSIPTASFTVPAANATNSRNDLIVATYTPVDIPYDTSASIATSSGGTVTHTQGTAFVTKESLTWTYVAGTPSATPADPNLPTNGVAIARIFVAANATSITSGNITLLLPSMQSAILGGLSGVVLTSSDQTVNGNKTLTGRTVIGAMTFINSGSLLNTIGIRSDAIGNMLLRPLDTKSILLGYDTPSMTAINFGPNNSWGYVDATGLHNADGSAVYGKNAAVGAGYVRAGAPPTGNFPAGSLISNDGNGGGRVNFGGSDSKLLYFDSASNTFRFAGGALSAGGTVTSPNGYIVNNPGAESAGALQFGRPGGTSTWIGSRGKVRDILGTAFNIETTGTGAGQLLALSAGGDLGIAGVIASYQFLADGTSAQNGRGYLKQLAFAWPNNSSGIGRTELGSSGELANGIVANLFGFKDAGSSQTLIAANLAGDFGAKGKGSFGGTLTSAGDASFGTTTARGAMYVGPQAAGGLQNGDIRTCRDNQTDGYIGFGNSGAALKLDGQNPQFAFVNYKLAASSVDFTTGNEGSFRRRMTVANTGTTAQPGRTDLGLRIPGPSNQQYNIYATVTTDLADSRTHSLSGDAGSGITWTRNNVTQQDIGGPMTIEIFGTANGGANLNVTYFCPEISGNSQPGLLRVEATPTYV